MGVIAECLVNWTSELTGQTKAEFFIFLSPTLCTSDNVPVNDAVAVKMAESERDLSQIEAARNENKQK